MANDIIISPEYQRYLAALLNSAYDALATASEERSSVTAKNYVSSLGGLRDYMEATGESQPTKRVLSSWRDAMLAGNAPRKLIYSDGSIETVYRKYAPRTVNARLSAVRQLLQSMADETTNVELKIILRDWSTVKDVKLLQVQEGDETEADFGLRLTEDEMTSLYQQIPDDLSGLRDRALIAPMLGAGLRVSEAVALTVADTFYVKNKHGQRGIKVRDGKHRKSRVSVIDGDSTWVLDHIRAWLRAAGISTKDRKARLYYGVTASKTGFVLRSNPLTVRGAQHIVSKYYIERDGEVLFVSAHDLRRSYALHCRNAGMEWDALRENMGHSTVEVTERYVGKEVDWSRRVPGWSLPHPARRVPGGGDSDESEG